jgi:hypothetical protein
MRPRVGVKSAVHDVAGALEVLQVYRELDAGCIGLKICQHVAERQCALARALAVRAVKAARGIEDRIRVLLITPRLLRLAR